MNKKATIQESEYKFPYHHIPQWDNGDFSQFVEMRWGYEYASYSQLIKNKVMSLDGENLLDVGCGDGRFLLELNKDTEKRLTGLDYFYPAVEFAKIMAPDVKWVAGDICDTSALSEQYSIITLIEALEHIPPDMINNFLKGIHYYLKDDGVFLLSVPHKNFTLHDKHYQHFDLPSLTKVLSPHFEVMDVQYINKKITGIKRMILRLITNKHYTITNKRINKWLFDYYCRTMLIADESNCIRMVATCKKLK